MATRRMCSTAVVLLLLSSVGMGADITSAPWQAADCGQRIVLQYANAEVAPDGALFFVDIAKVGAALGGAVDTASGQLFARGGDKAIPFSLDCRYGDREMAPGEIRKPITGYWSEVFPATEGKLRRLGFLSFKPVKGCSEYYLYFSLAKGNALPCERPDPSVRPWWIEAFTNPYFATDANNDGTPDGFSWVPKDRVKAKETIKIVPRDDMPGRVFLELSQEGAGQLMSEPRGGETPLDERVAGRRVVLYSQNWAQKEFAVSCMLDLPRKPGALDAAIAASAKGQADGRWMEWAVEGRVVPGFTGHKRRLLYLTYSGACRVGEIHAQFPPDPPTTNKLSVSTDIAAPGDDVTVTWESARQSYLYPLELPVEDKAGTRKMIPGNRLEDWRDGFVVAARLLPAGKEQAVAQIQDKAEAGVAWTGRLGLKDIAPGQYRLVVDVTSRRAPAETVAHMDTPLRVTAPAPF